LAAADARGYHHRLLAALEEFGPASQAVLGRRTGIDRSDVVAALNELAARGFIQRSPDPDDRRRNVITITPAGTEKLETLHQVLAGIQDKLLAPLPAADHTKLIELLTRLLEHDASTRRPDRSANSACRGSARTALRRRSGARASCSPV
jgi:DNA-binding MarR family transcriptional regulator